MQTNTMSPIMRTALHIVDTIREKIVNGECSEEELANSVTKFHPSNNKEYINPSDYCNADKAMKILGIGYNRNKFFDLTKQYGIENHKVNNAPLGYKVSEIERLKVILKEQNKKIRQRPIKKEGQTKFLFGIENY